MPENLLDAELEARREQITSQLAQASLTLEQYLAETEEDQTEEEFWADSRSGRPGPEGPDRLGQGGRGAQRQRRPERPDPAHHAQGAAGGRAPQQIADHLKEHPHHIEEYMLEIRRGKALALIVESATVTDTDGEQVELATLGEDGTYAADATASRRDGRRADSPSAELQPSAVEDVPLSAFGQGHVAFCGVRNGHVRALERMPRQTGSR